MTDTPENLLEAVRYFSDLDVCTRYMRRIKWPDGKPTCPHCQSERIGEIATRRMLRCKDCRKQFSCKVGTIFEDSPLGLDKWFVAVWCIANCKNGISSHELGRALGVTQKTAWFMLHRIREAMKTGNFRKLEGTIESDETYVGGRAANMHKAKREKKITGRGGVGKAIVQGLLERGGEVRASVIQRTDDTTLTTNVRKNVAKGANVFTDALPAYGNLCLDYIHRTVDHLTHYVSGVVHINGMENFFALLKRALKGTYVAVAPFHLERYVDEEAFRYNERKGTDGTRFDRAMQGVFGKRLTYRRLCAIGDAGFMGIE